MNSWQIAWRSIRQRGLASLLTTASMALGVTLVVAVISIYGVVSQQFKNNASLGYNLLVGATKGGRLQLTLNSVFYLSQPVENIEYQYFLEFVPDEQRRRELQNSLEMQEAVTAEERQEARRNLEIDREGEFSALTEFAIPLCLGDYFGRFRVVGTAPDFFEKLIVDQEEGARFEFAQGRAFERWNKEHGFFEAVVGSTVAQEMNVKLGDHLSPAHGDPEGHAHERYFVVTGILAPSGTPNDRAAFVNIEGFYLMEGHAKPINPDSEAGAADPAAADADASSGAENLSPDLAQGDADAASEELASADQTQEGWHFRLRQPLPLEHREVTAVLVKTVPFVGSRVMNIINEGKDAQCAQPVLQIFQLLEIFVRPIQWVLLGLTVMICLVSGISILVSIYNSMSDRRHEIAVIRALGASRFAVMTIVLLESVILSVGGGLLGWIGGHALNVSVSRLVEDRTGVSLGFFDIAPPIDFGELLGSGAVEVPVPPELFIIPGLIVLAVIVGFLPAMTAYRTDVARWLGK